MKWTEEQHNYLVDLKSKNLTWKEIAKEMSLKFDRSFTGEACRARWRTNRHKIDINPKEKYGKTIKKNADGTIEVDQLIAISKEQLKNEKYILEAHGYDGSWEIVSHQFSMWNHHNKQDGTKTLYASKVRVKPKETKFDKETLLNVIDRLPKIKIPKTKPEPPDELPYINIPLFDMHFGISDYDYYLPTQKRILHYLERPRKGVLFIIGQDLLHNDDFRGRTTSGREIQKIDMEQAIEDAWMFYTPLIETSIQNSEQVHVYYSNGNHDEFSGWAFVKMLEKRYAKENNIYFDSRLKERKVHMLGRNFIGMNHSDKKKLKFLAENFATEFPVEWSQATTREVFAGHEHKEEEIVQLTEDNKGIVLRRMPTRNKTDGWHYEMGYTTAHKRFMVLEYSETEVIDIHYV